MISFHRHFSVETGVILEKCTFWAKMGEVTEANLQDNKEMPLTRASPKPFAGIPAEKDSPIGKLFPTAGRCRDSVGGESPHHLLTCPARVWTTPIRPSAAATHHLMAKLR